MGAIGSRRYLAFVKETVAGELPDPANATKIRNTGGSGIAAQRSQLQSEELRSDRQIEDMRLGNLGVNLEVPSEFSYGAFDALLESLLFNEWVDGGTGEPDELVAGTQRVSLSVEEGFEDISEYILGEGFLANQLQLNIQPDAMVQATWSLVGLKTGEMASTSYMDDVAEAASNSPFDSFTGRLELDDSEVAAAVGIQLTLANGVEPKYPLFQKSAHRLLDGRSNLTGELNLDFEDDTYWNAFLNETEMKLYFELEDMAGNKYQFTIPRIKFAGNSRSVSENDVTQTVPFAALRDDMLGSQIKIERVEAV